MQFTESKSKIGKCPVCGAPVPVRNAREPVNYCSQKCKSQRRFATRYRGTGAGPLDRPTLIEKTKLP